MLILREIFLIDSLFAELLDTAASCSTMAMVDNLSNLPLEIIEMITSSDLYRSDICALQRTCRSLHEITQPILYRNLECKFKKKYVYISDSEEWWSQEDTDMSSTDSLELEPDFKPKIHLLLRSLSLRPELGSLIRSVDFLRLAKNRRIWRGKSPQLTPDELECLAARGRSITGQQRERWLKK